MASRARRIHDFHGTDSEYITYLESLVLQGTANGSPLSPPRSDIHDGAVDHCHSDGSSANSLKFVSYQPQTDSQTPLTKPHKKKRVERRWERLMDEMINNIMAEEWLSRRRAVGLSSQAGILMALDMVIHGTNPQIVSANEENLSIPYCHPSNTVLQLLNTFATTTAALKIQATLTKQVHFFRVFVFVSLCCVALHDGADQTLVDEIMQKCVSDSCKKNLARLRKGALWVNRMMVKLAMEGFDYLAYEVFVLWGQSIAHYGRFADAGERGISYFLSHIPRFKPGVEIQASLPFWVPFIIKTIAGDVFSLPAICTALGYSTDPRIHDYLRYLDNYRNRRMMLPRPLGLEAIAPLADASSGHRDGVLALDSTTIRIQTLLEAAQQSDRISRSIPDGRLPNFGDSSTMDRMTDCNGGSLLGSELNTGIDGWQEDMTFFNYDWVLPMA